MIKTVYRRSSPDMFSKEAFCCRYVAYLQGIPIQKCDFSRVKLTLLHGRSPVNWLNVEQLS